MRLSMPKNYSNLQREQTKKILRNSGINPMELIKEREKSGEKEDIQYLTRYSK